MQGSVPQRNSTKALDQGLATVPTRMYRKSWCAILGRSDFEPSSLSSVTPVRKRSTGPVVLQNLPKTTSTMWSAKVHDSRGVQVMGALSFETISDDLATPRQLGLALELGNIRKCIPSREANRGWLCEATSHYLLCLFLLEIVLLLWWDLPNEAGGWSWGQYWSEKLWLYILVSASSLTRDITDIRLKPTRFRLSSVHVNVSTISFHFGQSGSYWGQIGRIPKLQKRFLACGVVAIVALTARSAFTKVKNASLSSGLKRGRTWAQSIASPVNALTNRYDSNLHLLCVENATTARTQCGTANLKRQLSQHLDIISRWFAWRISWMVTWAAYQQRALVKVGTPSGYQLLFILHRQHRVISVWSQQLWEGQALTYHLCSIDHHKLGFPRSIFEGKEMLNIRNCAYSRLL